MSPNCPGALQTVYVWRAAERAARPVHHVWEF
jgi:hypothetical protein